MYKLTIWLNDVEFHTSTGSRRRNNKRPKGPWVAKVPGRWLPLCQNMSNMCELRKRIIFVFRTGCHQEETTLQTIMVYGIWMYMVIYDNRIIAYCWSYAFVSQLLLPRLDACHPFAASLSSKRWVGYGRGTADDKVLTYGIQYGVGV